jgi:hypothetical protein
VFVIVLLYLFDFIPMRFIRFFLKSIMLLALLAAWSQFPHVNMLANDEQYHLQITPSDAKEVDTLIKAGDFAKAEKRAIQKGLDPRVTGTIMAFAGKKSEMCSTFIAYINGLPKDQREEVAFQSVNLVHNASVVLSEALLEEFIREGFLQDSSDRVKSRQVIMQMFQDNDVTGAAKRIAGIIRSASAIHSDVWHLLLD